MFNNNSTLSLALTDTPRFVPNELSCGFIHLQTCKYREKNLMFSEQFGHFLNIMTEEIKDEKIDIEDHFLPAPSISDEDQPEK